MDTTVKKVVTLVDFTGVSQLALEHTAILARASICRVFLLHIAENEKRGEEKEIKSKIRTFASVLEKEGISFAIQVNFGSFFDVVHESIQALSPDLVVTGTHGIKGVKMNYLHSNIHQLITKLDVPTLVIQGHSQVPQEGFCNLMVPSLGLGNCAELKRFVPKLASLFDSKLLLLTFYHNENLSEREKSCQDLADEFNQKGILTTVQMEESLPYSSSFSKSIIQIADIEEIDLLVIAYKAEPNKTPFSTEDFENILLNRSGTPVLCL